MENRYFSKSRLIGYFIPILIGLGGIAFSQQLTSVVMRVTVIMLSVSIPLFVGGNLLARSQTGKQERLLLFFGIFLLVIGASVSISDLPNTLLQTEMLPEFVVDTSRLIGICSVLLGLFAVLYSVVRTREDVEAIGGRFRHLAEHINEGFVLTRADGPIFMVNQRFLDMFDLKRTQVIGKNATSLARHLETDTVKDAIQQRAKGIASEYEITAMVRGEERRFWFNGTPIYNERGRHTATLATVRDTTEQHRLSQRVERYAEELQKRVEHQEQQLVQSEARFRKLLVSMNEGFLTIDDNHCIQFANARVCELLGEAEQVVIGRKIFDFVDTQGRVRLLNLLARGAVRSATESREELSFVNAEGETIPCVVAVAYLGEDSEKDTVYSLVLTSLVRQKEMQRELEERAHELERANAELLSHDRAKDAFLSNVSHELRTPLSTIQGYVEMLHSDNLGTLSGPQQSALQVMERNAERLGILINEMIEFSRMEIRGIQLSLDLFGIERLLHEAIASIHPHTMAKDISTNYYVSDSLTFAWFDREKIAQVLGILLNNAVKFTDDGGMIQLNAQQGPDNTLQLSVSDTGIGIDEAHKEKIFTKFYQVDSSKTRRYEGAGIGLSIAKSIVEAHGGKIQIDSEMGKGSVFHIILPHACWNAAAVDPSFETDILNGVLLIDEKKESKEAVASVLDRWGLTWHHAPNGYDGVRTAETEQPDLILLNDTQQDRAGTATLNLLRQQPATADIPVLVFSGEAPGHTTEIAGMWNEAFFLDKPFSVKTLQETIGKALSGTPFTLLSSADEPVEEENESHPQILVLDADSGLLEWFSIALQKHDILCVGSTSLSHALNLVQNHPPVAIFLDVDVACVRVLDHVEAFRAQESTKNVPIYAMTGGKGETHVQVDISGIIHKPLVLKEVLRIVQACIETKETYQEEEKVSS